MGRVVWHRGLGLDTLPALIAAEQGRVPQAARQSRQGAAGLCHCPARGTPRPSYLPPRSFCTIEVRELTRTFFVSESELVSRDKASLLLLGHVFIFNLCYFNP